MRAVYVDTSVLVAVAFGEPAGAAIVRKLRRMDVLFGATLVESEFLAAAAREGVLDNARSMLDAVRFVHPPRRLTTEAELVLRHARLRGADLHHLATALFLFPRPSAGFFLTLDAAQGEAAATIGFGTLADL